jgi:hypothetical protein
VEAYLGGSIGCAILVASLIWAWFEYYTSFKYHMAPQIDEAAKTAKPPPTGGANGYALLNPKHF